MKIFVKVLRGDNCPVDVHADMTILDIKKQIEKNVKVPVSQQTLVLLGKTLADDQTVSCYPRIKDGTKLHLVIKKPEGLQEVLTKFLRRYYDEAQTKTVMEEFMKDFNMKINSLSLDDLERIATSYMDEERT